MAITDIRKFVIRDGASGEIKPINIRSDLDVITEKIQKRISRLERINRKSRWIDASKRK